MISPLESRAILVTVRSQLAPPQKHKVISQQQKYLLVGFKRGTSKKTKCIHYRGRTASFARAVQPRKRGVERHFPGLTRQENERKQWNTVKSRVFSFLLS